MQEEKETGLENDRDTCGGAQRPLSPGGEGAGDWQCKTGVWTWVENIGIN